MLDIETIADSGSPVMGRLVDSELERLNTVRGRIHALRDIATEQQRNRRRRTHLGLHPIRGVTVGHRKLLPRSVRKGVAT